MCLYMNWKVCHFHRYIETEGLLKVTGSHIHCKNGNISEMVQDIHVTTHNTNRK